MMNLKTQILVLLFSFSYGIFFSFFYEIMNKWFYEKRRIIRYPVTFFFIFLNVITYFVILKKINDGIIHIYSFFSILVGFLLEEKIHKVIAFHLKK